MSKDDWMNRDPISFGTKDRFAQRRPLSASRGPRVPHVIIGGIEKKSCAKCAQLKPLDAFSADQSAFDSLYGYCRECVAARDRERRMRSTTRKPRIT